MNRVYKTADAEIIHGDIRDVARDMEPHSIDAICTSPPYWNLRDYGIEGQIGIESDFNEYLEELTCIFEILGENVLKKTGSLWLNMGDSYSKKKLTMIPERLAIRLVDTGWVLRNKVIWRKKNSMPTSAKDRLANKWEYIFHFTRKTKGYHYDLDAIREPHSDVSLKRGESPFHANSPYVHTDDSSRMGDRWLHPLGKNPGDVWDIAASGYKGAHFATYPVDLMIKPILATVPEGGTVLDPFLGSGTTMVTALNCGRKAIGVDMHEKYCMMAANRLESAYANSTNGG